MVALNSFDIDRIIEMVWEDRTPFNAILKHFILNEFKVFGLMRKEEKLFYNEFSIGDCFLM